MYQMQTTNHIQEMVAEKAVSSFRLEDMKKSKKVHELHKAN